jgi:hypothetical protein
VIVVTVEAFDAHITKLADERGRPMYAHEQALVGLARTLKLWSELRRTASPRERQQLVARAAFAYWLDAYELGYAEQANHLLSVFGEISP